MNYHDVMSLYDIILAREAAASNGLNNQNKFISIDTA